VVSRCQEGNARKYFRDTNVLITLLNNRSTRLKEIIMSHPSKDIKIPSMVKGELLVGAYKKEDTELRLDNIRKILLAFDIVPFDDAAAAVYGRIRAELEMKGNTIGPCDMVIAATVLSQGGILVTGNTREFKRVEGLQVVDWIGQRGD